MTISYRMPESPNMQTTQVAHLRMLVVEDQPFQRRLLAGLLKSFGVATVVEAHDGNEGLAALDREADGFDIAFVDLKMDGMDGIEFLRHAAQRSVRAFIVTSALEPELFSYVSELGSSFGASILGTLKKPITPDHISAHIAHFVTLDTRRQTGRVAATPPPRPWSRAALETALANGEFIPFFQPKIDLKSRRAVGVEVLARWRHPTMGILPPSQFIGRMETEGLIDGLTECIVAAALSMSGEWEARGTSLNIAVNVSPLTLQKTDIAKRLLSLVRHYRAAPEGVTIEVTETAVSQDAAGLLETLTRLRMQGFNLSVDDFGTGYSSLQQLSELPFNEVKIDRSFVHGSRNNSKATIILESIIQLGSKLGMQMVAEGIETEDELQYLRQLGCPTVQGFYLAYPMSHPDLLAFLEGQRR